MSALARRRGLDLGGSHRSHRPVRARVAAAAARGLGPRRAAAAGLFFAQPTCGSRAELLERAASQGETVMGIMRITAILQALSRLSTEVLVHGQRVSSTHGVTGLELVFLRWLAAGQPASIGDLQRRTSLPPATLGEIVEALERKGLAKLELVPKPGAGPELVATLTGEGLKLVADAPPPPFARLADQIAKLSLENQAALDDAFGLLVDMLDGAEETEAAPAPSWTINQGQC